MPFNSDLLQQAAAGSTAAQSNLVDLAIAAGASGAVRQIESLIAAETWARLAAANGGIEEQRALVGVLLARAKFEVERCSTESAEWYEGEARRILKLLVALDDADAQRALDELGEPGEVQPDGPDAQELALLSAAARGDTHALDALGEQAMSLFYSGAADALEALTVAELYARLGATSGHLDLMRRLAGVRLKRAEFEYRDGSDALGNDAIADATVLLSILVDGGDASMAPWLRLLVNDAPMTALEGAVRYRPTILKFIEPEGTC
ncbi:MAG: hypothetical protein V3V60_07825 [Sphingomonas aquatilis]|jgi:hypothetical protein|uniref:hypothetical protein n=1 Tax=Sphingomonas aquatilis TaxID=93063 RepID=UPI002F2FE990